MKLSREKLNLAYQGALNLVAEGKLDRGRLERGYDLVQTKEFQEEPHKYNGYMITEYSCTCPDAVQSFVTCKHQIAHCLLKVARELTSETNSIV